MRFCVEVDDDIGFWEVIEVVVADDEGFTFAFAEIFHDIGDHELSAFIEGSEGFVDEDELSVICEGACEGESSFDSEREFEGVRCHCVSESVCGLSDESSEVAKVDEFEYIFIFEEGCIDGDVVTNGCV